MDRTLSVSEFIREINELLSFPVTVEGEVSSFGISQGKWVFFDLKDEAVESKVGCFMPVWKLKTPLEDGMRVRVYGSPRIHEKSGKFSITVEQVELVGEGALKRAFELLSKKLEAEGLFAPERKRILPRFPERIGLIASRESAAYSDFMRILSNRWGGLEIQLAHVQVQGAVSSGQIVEALNYFSSSNVEAVVLIRGGGSFEDMQAFNSEEVARAIFGSRVPVVVGVGHEPDVSIADFVADLRASTPSNAAERLVPDRREIMSEIEYAVGRVRGYFESVLARHAHRISVNVQTLFRMVGMQRARFNGVLGLLTSQLRQFGERLVHYRGRVDFLSRTAANLHPERLLERGYAIVRSGGKIIKDVTGLKLKSAIAVRLHKGEVSAEVISTSL